MTDDAASASADAGSGAMLQAAREQRQLSVDEVAHELRLTPDIIVALEAGDFESLGPAVFVRGYLRNYAKLLELEPQRVLDEFPVAHIEPEEFRTMSLPREVKQGVNLHGWLLWSLSGAALLAAAAIFLASLQDPADERTTAAATVPSEPVVPEPVVPAPASEAVASGDDLTESASVQDAEATIEPGEDTVATDDAVAVSDQTDNAESADAATTAVPEAPAATEMEQSVEEPATAAAEGGVTPGAVTLRLTFSEECWVEIADSRRSLLYGLEKRGSVVDLEGVPPFKIFVGNRQAVQIAVAGKPYAIPATPSDSGNTARFTVREVSFQ